MRRKFLGIALLLPAMLWSCTHVETGSPAVAPVKPGTPGAIDQGDVEDMVKGKLGDLDGCYREERQRNPQAAGKVLIAFDIQRDGQTGEVRLLASTLKSPVMEGCLVGKVEAWKFPQPHDAQVVKVRYPFSFQP